MASVVIFRLRATRCSATLGASRGNFPNVVRRTKGVALHIREFIHVGHDSKITNNMEHREERGTAEPQIDMVRRRSKQPINNSLDISGEDLSLLTENVAEQTIT